MKEAQEQTPPLAAYLRVGDPISRPLHLLRLARTATSTHSCFQAQLLPRTSTSKGTAASRHKHPPTSLMAMSTRPLCGLSDSTTSSMPGWYLQAEGQRSSSKGRVESADVR